MKVRGPIHDYWACLLAATSCGDVDKCVYAGPIGPCPATGGFNSCEGNGVTRVACSTTQGATTPALATNCAAQGRSCFHPMAMGSIAYCGASAAGMKTTCTSGCNGASITDCNADAGVSFVVDLGRDCTNVGEGKCAVVDGPLGACVPTSDANDCGGGKALDCKSTTTVRDCRTGAQDFVDCAGLGGKCVIDAGAIPSGSVWDPAYACAGAQACGADTCASSGVITSCFQGISFSLDCKAQGLPGCTTTTEIPVGLDFMPTQTKAACRKP
jgi:hypothetical protein